MRKYNFLTKMTGLTPQHNARKEKSKIQKAETTTKVYEDIEVKRLPETNDKTSFRRNENRKMRLPFRHKNFSLFLHISGVVFYIYMCKSTGEKNRTQMIIHCLHFKRMI